MTFNENDKVALVRDGKVRNLGVVRRVGATCLYCWDDDGNQFHSHTENFISLEPKKGPLIRGICQVFTNTPEGPGAFRMHYEDKDGNHVDPYDKTKADCMNNFQNAEGHDPQIIGIAGRKGHGKDTAGQGLAGFENVKFAGPLKEMTRAFMRYIGMNEDTIERCVDGDMKEIPLACFGGRTTRFFMQKIGTEFGREMIWEDIWTSAFQDRAKQFDKVVCTDMRFPNEVDLIKAMGGRTVRIINPSAPMPMDAHISETAIDTLPVSMEIVNDGSIWDLHEKIRWAFDPFAPVSVFLADEGK